MFIENVLGFHDINRLEHKLSWHPKSAKRHGIRNLRFADVTTDIIWENGEVMVNSSRPYRIEINTGPQTIKLCK